MYLSDLSDSQRDGSLVIFDLENHLTTPAGSQDWFSIGWYESKSSMGAIEVPKSLVGILASVRTEQDSACR